MLYNFPFFGITGKHTKLNKKTMQNQKHVKHYLSKTSASRPWLTVNKTTL